MRNLLLITFLLASTFLIAQSHAGQWCGTAHSGEEYEQLKARLLANRAAVAAGIVTPRTTRYVPLKFHLAAEDDGSGRLNENRVLDQLCELNEDFAPLDLQFYLADGSFNYIDDSDLYENHLAVQSGVMDRQRDTRAINIFIVKSASTTYEEGISVPDGTIAYYNLIEDWIVIDLTYVRLNDSSLSHELGHFFSLLHTFNGYESEPHNTPGVNAPVFSPLGPRTEFADGSNCANAGDFLCDTPADYNNGLGARSCDLTANILDPRGEAISPDERNMLGYFLLCPDEEYFFSADQIATINADYASRGRRFLRLDPVPEVTPLGNTPTAVYPPENGSSEFYDQIPFEWTATPGATRYLFELSRLSSFQLISERRVVEGTSFNLTTELLPDRRYFWRVRPFNAHTACTAELPNRYRFETSDASFTTATTELKALTAFRVAPNPVIGTDDLVVSLQADQGFQAQLQLLNLNGQLVQAPQKLVLDRGSQQIHLSVSDLPSGVYFLRMVSLVGQATQKVIIAR